jgi:putative PIG3 family NAD(P)H quinone oxidoreductase
MHAVVTSGAGGVEVLGWGEVPDPVPADGEVVIDVVASAVNRADLLQRQGFYPPPPGAPDIIGLECSGRLSEVTPGAEQLGWRVGDQVCALLSGGGYAEKVAVPAGQCMRVPAGIDVETAAALPEVGCTVWSNVVTSGRLSTGDSFLVHGGASGIGTMAIQVALALGAVRVLCTVGSEEKAAACRELGADLAINYREGDFVAVAKSLCPDGVDVVLDIMGAAYLARNLDLLAVDGRLVVIGLQGGTKAEVDLGSLLRKRATVHATTLRSRPMAQKAAICRTVADRLWPLVEAGDVRPVIGARFPMTEVAKAHQLVEASGHIGKVLLIRP